MHMSERNKKEAEANNINVVIQDIFHQIPWDEFVFRRT